MESSDDPRPCVSSHWYTCHTADELPVYEQVISEARAIEESLARLGRQATPPDIQEDLKRLGLEIPLATIMRVTAELIHPGPS